MKIWRAASGELARTLTGHTQAVVSVDISPDSKLVASGGDDAAVRIWRIEDGALVRTLTGGSGHVYAVAFSPDGKLLASGSREKGNLGTLWKQIFGHALLADGRTIRLWHVGDGRLAATLVGHPGDVHGLAFSPDGTSLASSGESPAIRIWSLKGD